MQTNGYVKTIGACTEGGYKPVGRIMAVKTISVCKKQAIDQQADKWLC